MSVTNRMPTPKMVITMTIHRSTRLNTHNRAISLTINLLEMHITPILTIIMGKEDHQVDPKYNRLETLCNYWRHNLIMIQIVQIMKRLIKMWTVFSNNNNKGNTNINNNQDKWICSLKEMITITFKINNNISQFNSKKGKNK